jgi:hypothetical protein
MLNNSSVLMAITKQEYILKYTVFNEKISLSTTSSIVCLFDENEIGDFLVLDKHGELYVINSPYVFDEDYIHEYKGIFYRPKLFKIQQSELYYFTLSAI